MITQRQIFVCLFRFLTNHKELLTEPWNVYLKVLQELRMCSVTENYRPRFHSTAKDDEIIRSISRVAILLISDGNRSHWLRTRNEPPSDHTSESDSKIRRRPRDRKSTRITAHSVVPAHRTSQNRSLRRRSWSSHSIEIRSVGQSMTLYQLQTPNEVGRGGWLCMAVERVTTPPGSWGKPWWQQIVSVKDDILKGLLLGY